MASQKDEKEGVRYRRQDTHEQLKQGKLQVGRKDHHKSSRFHHMVSSCFNDEGNILRLEGGTTIGKATTRGSIMRILILKSEPRYSINQLHKEESRSKDLKHQTLAER